MRTWAVGLDLAVRKQSAYGSNCFRLMVDWKQRMCIVCGSELLSVDPGEFLNFFWNLEKIWDLDAYSHSMVVYV
uniref:Uncharacterized protein n=1 Tax=Human betaherpesvirus 6 TaxID=10368 RepID=A0A1W6DA59_9BETA|nr:hypothetical protein [Human betaherpesvirus 6]QFV56873.1 hypothetical protein [Human betaherpesvirus 6]QFV62370.1 hypothetical protein [Human betaherpesvirus 6]QGM49542.1 hypothetical protein [Human betaherpesvirus 6]QGM49579.1 hypothetical protein [Human betaherpesvirus 6]